MYVRYLTYRAGHCIQYHIIHDNRKEGGIGCSDRRARTKLGLKFDSFSYYLFYSHHLAQFIRCSFQEIRRARWNEQHSCDLDVINIPSSTSSFSCFRWKRNNHHGRWKPLHSSRSMAPPAVRSSDPLPDATGKGIWSFEQLFAGWLVSFLAVSSFRFHLSPHSSFPAKTLQESGCRSLQVRPFIAFPSCLWYSTAI